MQAFLNHQAVEIRHDFILELEPEEELRLHPVPDAVTLRNAPGGIPPTIGEDGTVTLHEVGRHHLIVEHNGERQDLHLLCFEPALLDWVANATRPATSNGGAVKPPRLIVRSLCEAPWFNGTIASTPDWLAHFGA